jgi:hypothetical protein
VVGDASGKCGRAEKYSRYPRWFNLPGCDFHLSGDRPFCVETQAVGGTPPSSPTALLRAYGVGNRNEHDGKRAKHWKQHDGGECERT